MSLLKLPNEILLQVVDGVDCATIFNNLSRTCRRFYTLFNNILYQFDAKKRSGFGSACFWAAEHGNLGTLRCAVAAGVNVFDTRLCLLHKAVYGGHEAVVNFLLPGVEIDVKDMKGYTPLVYATMKGFLGIVQMLLDRGANPEGHGQRVSSMLDWEVDWEDWNYGDNHSKDDDAMWIKVGNGARTSLSSTSGATPLHYAAWLGTMQVAKLLISHQAELGGKTNDGYTPLVLAVYANNYEIAALLLEARLDLATLPKIGKPVLDFAIQGGNIGMVRLLLEFGAGVLPSAASDGFPLHIAAFHGHMEIAELLLSYDVDIHTYDRSTPDRSTPLAAAITGGDADMAMFLLSLEVHEPANDPDQGWPLHAAARMGAMGLMEPILLRGVNVMRMDSQGWTPLALAVRNENYDMTKLLLDNGAHVDSKGDFDSPAINLAAEAGNAHLVGLLLKRGADVSATDDKGMQPLNFAALHNHSLIAYVLLKRGAGVNDGDVRGQTPLMSAAIHGHLEMVKLLLSHGANAHQRDAFGRTAADAAKRHHRTEIARLLKKS